ncbi:hypothetical protein RRF57_008689 [Xylaria bambusicola]|uniref:Uncharacterized protein n=1 Tax=Xylaria bambusicola TaxID=326684 RepID=A0AAN7Z0X5_9PEZI
MEVAAILRDDGVDDGAAAVADDDVVVALHIVNVAFGGAVSIVTDRPPHLHAEAYKGQSNIVEPSVSCWSKGDEVDAKGFQVLTKQSSGHSIGDSAHELGIKDFSLDYLGHESTGFYLP